ncbi:MAG TPA: type II secretion system protein M [Pseudomonadales bacterium]|nr:type II secretion system protein M [Pseudomonadales bacterium]
MKIFSNPYIRNLSVRYRSLEQRDRVALVGLGAFLAGLLLFYGVWTPANNFAESRRAERDRELALVKYMKASEAEARASKSSATPTVSGQALLTQISRTAQQFSINPNRLQPEGSDGVSVWFDDVVFNDLIRWLELQTRQGVNIRQISIDRQPDSGKVNARIVLRS